MSQPKQSRFSRNHILTGAVAVIAMLLISRLVNVLIIQPNLNPTIPFDKVRLEVGQPETEVLAILEKHYVRLDELDAHGAVQFQDGKHTMAVRFATGKLATYSVRLPGGRNLKTRHGRCCGNEGPR